MRVELGVRGRLVEEQLVAEGRHALDDGLDRRVGRALRLGRDERDRHAASGREGKQQVSFSASEVLLQGDPGARARTARARESDGGRTSRTP